MNDEDLEVLVTVDDPEYGPDEDIFNHVHPGTYKKESLAFDQHQDDDDNETLVSFISS